MEVAEESLGLEEGHKACHSLAEVEGRSLRRNLALHLGYLESHVGHQGLGTEVDLGTDSAVGLGNRIAVAEDMVVVAHGIGLGSDLAVAGVVAGSAGLDVRTASMY